MSLEEVIRNQVPRDSLPATLAELRAERELGLEEVCKQEDISYTTDGDGWRTRVVLRDEKGDFHCHRYQAWIYGSRWECWRDYIGNDPVTVMKWLCGEEVAT